MEFESIKLSDLIFNLYKEQQMIDAKIIDDLANKLSDAIPPGLKKAQQETEKHVKSVLQAGLAKLDVVSRDEFDAQVRVLQRTREKLEALEKTIAEIEQNQK